MSMQIHERDNVGVVIETGHKVALCDIPCGAQVIKYGYPIGRAKVDIKAGEHVHAHNVASALCGLVDWDYIPTAPVTYPSSDRTWLGYERSDGQVGTRNELWIIPTVGCVASTAKELAARTGAKAMLHPYGCSQLGDDLGVTQKILCALARHPNAGGVLVLGLGCENNRMEEMKAMLADRDPARIRFLNTQDVCDELAEGQRLLEELREIMKNDRRTPVSFDRLRIGVKCGGSDGYSGITANPLVGRLSDRMAKEGAAILMSELPEAFGAEQILLSRAVNRQVFDSAATMLRDFRQYFIDHGEGISDNPSPGNMAGGITTLEEKSLGCVQKAGSVPLCGALHYGELPQSGGLWLVDGPGNDQVAVTNLMASGAQLILFTTGRGTPLSAPVPTLKLSTNTPLAEKKPQWIDFNAGALLAGADWESLTDALVSLCEETAEGRPTCAERANCYDIAIFKDGVTL